MLQNKKMDYSDEDIIKALKAKGYNISNVDDAERELQKIQNPTLTDSLMDTLKNLYQESGENVKHGTAALLSGAQNIGRAAAPFVSPGAGIANASHPIDFYKAMNIQKSDDLLSAPGISEVIGGAMSFPFVGLEKLGYNIASPFVKEVLAKALGKIGSGATFGAVNNPDDRLSGAAYGAAIPAAFESAKLPLQFIKAYAEKINPIQWAQDVSKRFQNWYQIPKQEAKDVYENANKTLGQDKVSLDNYNKHAANEDVMSAYSPDMKDWHNKLKSKLELDRETGKYIKGPTWENLNEFKEAAGQKIGALLKNPMGTGEFNELQNLQKIRDAAKKDLTSHAENTNKPLADELQEANKKYSTVKQFEQHPIIHQIAEGNRDDATPELIKKALDDMKYKGFMKENPNHPLSQIYPEVKQKVGEAKGLGSFNWIDKFITSKFQNPYITEPAEKYTAAASPIAEIIQRLLQGAHTQ